MKYRRIGDLLCDTGLLTVEQLKNALDMQQLTHERLGELLVRKGHVTEAQVLEILDFQLGIPHVTLTETHIDRSSVMRIPEVIAKQYSCLALRTQGDKLIVAMEDPVNQVILDAIRSVTGYDIVPVLAAKSELQRHIELLYGRITLSSAYVREPFAPSYLSTPSIYDLTQVIYKVLEDAIVQRASSIHIDHWTNQVAIQFRVDGTLHIHQVLPRFIAEALFSRIRDLARIPTEGHKLHEGNIHFLNGRLETVFTVSIVPTLQGEKCTIRDISAQRCSADFGLTCDAKLMSLHSTLQLNQGLILLAVPSTQSPINLVHQLLAMSRRPDRQLISFETPSEQLLSGVHQIELNWLHRLGDIRRLLQFDANVIALPELGAIQPEDLRQLAYHSLVLLVTPTLPSSYASVQYLSRIGLRTDIDEELVRGIVVQCKVRTSCENCATETRILDARVEESPDIPSQLEGCVQCGFTGFSGETTCYEVVPVDTELQDLIRRGFHVTETQWQNHLIARDIIPIQQQLITLALMGRTSLSEVRRVLRQ
jgi:type IV pilus assembly protein PilB